MLSPTRLAIVLLVVVGVLYFYGLKRAGMLGPDEPRYAAIGLSMAQSGDWVTPKLWKQPWFEKPPLNYWMTALGARAGLGPETAPRLPVAMLGFGFVLFFYFHVRREYGPTEALYATTVLATCAGWLAYSYVAVTDVPMAVFFCAALFLSFEWAAGGKGSPVRALSAGALLGLAVLAKGLVPLVLFAPMVWPMRRRLGHLALIAGACAAIAGPWYVECTLRNGSAFIDEFIWKHHFQRFASDSLQHVRPFWFYVPVLLAVLFPWTPLIALVRPGLFRDARLRFAGAWLLFALLFFSASRNKLPGYLIPLLPVAALILGLALAWARRTRIPLFLCALSMAIAPVVVAILPRALEVGFSRTPWIGVDLGWGAAFVLLAAGPLWLEFRTYRTEALALTTLIAAAGFLYIKAAALPMTDRVRPFYHEHSNWLDPVCLQDVDRDTRYSLQYYAGREFPVCKADEVSPKILGSSHKLQLLD